MSYLLLVRNGDKYGPEYVEAIRKQTDYQVKEIAGDWPGWWGKMSIFSPERELPFIYIDLDSFILDDISPLMGKTMICREWHPNIKGCGQYQSSVIAMGKHRLDIWNEWIQKPDYWMSQFRGDQNFLERFDWDCIQDFYPDMVGSYKIHEQQDFPKTRIVTFHGKPKMKDAEGWAKDLWISLNSEKN